MEEALLDLLQSLRAIDAAHDGLGDTNVRDHMMADVFRGYLKPVPGFEPTGEYGLTPAANALIGQALGKFFSAAAAATKREGLGTFHQRLASFQKPPTGIAGAVTSEDYFGYVDPAWFDASGNDQRQARADKAAKIKANESIRRACVFDFAGPLEALRAALNAQRTWSWQSADGGPLGDPSIEARPEDGVWVQIRDGLETLEADGSYSPPEHDFMALVEASPDRLDAVDTTFRRLLKQAGANNFADASDYDW